MTNNNCINERKVLKDIFFYKIFQNAPPSHGISASYINRGLSYIREALTLRMIGLHPFSYTFIYEIISESNPFLFYFFCIYMH